MSLSFSQQFFAIISGIPYFVMWLLGESMIIFHVFRVIMLAVGAFFRVIIGISAQIMIRFSMLTMVTTFMLTSTVVTTFMLVFMFHDNLLGMNGFFFRHRLMVMNNWLLLMLVIKSFFTPILGRSIGFFVGYIAMFAMRIRFFLVSPI